MSFSFGSPSSAPASGGLGGGGFSFGANKQPTPGLGLTVTSQPTGLFGATPTTSTPAFGTSTPAFGTTPAFGAAGSTSAFGSTTAPAFGTSSTAPTFGSTAAPAFGSTATPAFGTTTSTPAFGATSAAPAFGATSTAPTIGGTGLGLSFGAGTNTSASTGLSFGAPATTTTASSGLGGLGGLGFGTVTTSAGGFGLLGNPSTAPSSSGLFVPIMFNYQHGSPAPLIPITQTFQILPPVSQGHSVVQNDLSGISPIPDSSRKRNLNYEVKYARKDCYKTLTPSIGATLGGTSTAASVAPSLGLGGVATTTSGIGANTTTGDNKAEQPKQQKLPNEILNPVESFKEFVKKQKGLSSEVMRVTAKPLYKVSQEVENTLRSVVSLAGEISRARAHSKRLRSVAAAALAAAEAAAPHVAVSELEGSAPPSYVKELIAELEQQVITFRRQMDVADKQMQASPKLLTEQELTLGIRRMHESLVALAGRLQAVHTQVEAQKEQYLNLRKYILKDPTNVFEVSPSTSLDQILHDAEGTRRKTNLGGFTDMSFGSAVLSDPRAALGSMRQLAGPTPFSYLGNTLSPFPNADNSAASWTPQPQGSMTPSLNVNFGAGTANTSSAFQLQKPPGKRVKQ